jgi:putative transcriptional regulator
MATDLAPGFLVAAPSLLDPNFRHSVVLLIDHRPDGSLGFIVNRPSDVTFEGVVQELGLSPKDRSPPQVPVLVGGPVAPHTGWIVFDPTTTSVSLDSTIEVSSRLRVSASREILRELAHGQHQASRHLLVLGYAGWGAGQLDNEIKQGAWIPVDLDEAVVFETPYPRRWNAALEALGIDPLHIVGTATEA